MRDAGDAPPGSLSVIPVTAIPPVQPGSDLSDLICAALLPANPGGPELCDGDVVVVTQKIVSKAEGRIVTIDTSDPLAKSKIVESESVRVLRRRRDLLITETRHGFICANAGVDLSNVDSGTAALLPVDPDRSARRLNSELKRRLGVTVGVVISDTFGRAWRNGVTDVAIGCAGVSAVLDLRGHDDAQGRTLTATQVCIVDEIASAAEIVMGKDRNIPVAIVRGVPRSWMGSGSVSDQVIRRPSDDLFR
ncbi:MAG: coenzyme F420-0:L-glutamate ligase [Actinobacteria bacterium]|nr:coenzyme F420-0:L-glutamate ligase [Actinomycetota bacterium]